ncbi:MAG: hypothetical protein KTR24_13575 [Saprospiraceae bacterium]|nr:hypothetical protein [Saprospiraceae bacterium]
MIDSSITHLRPRFRVEVNARSQELIEAFSQALDSKHPGLEGLIKGQHIILDIAHDRRHYWSPQLNMRVENHPQEEQKSIVAGLIGPRPNVWTLFMFIYFSIGTLGFIIGSIGVSRALLGTYSPLLWAFPIAILFMLSAFLTSKKGERMAKDQTEELKEFVRGVINR